MDPTQEKQQEQKQGPISQGINVINNFRGIRSPFGRIGSGAATQIARGLTGFLAANPWVWVVLGIITLASIVFVIIISGVAPGAPPQGTTTQTPAP